MAEAAPPTETTCKIRHIHIECPICLNRFTDPKILDCHHSFCLKCLQELVAKYDQKEDCIICPVCREKTSIPEKGVSALFNCFFLSSLIDDVIHLEGPEEDINPPVLTCEGCDEGLEAVSRCVDCDANLCDICLENHAKLKMNRHHQIVNAVGSSNQRPENKGKLESPKCRKHTDQELCFYCDTCDLLVCLKCVAFDHRAQNHILTEITACVQSHRQAVEAELMKFDECRKHFQKVDDSIKHSQHRLQLMVDRALRDIVAKEEEEITKIRNASRLLQERVTQIGQERGEEFESKLSSNHDKMSRAEQIVASVKDLMQQADDFELLDLKSKIMHNLTFHKELQFQALQHSKSFIGFKGHIVVTDADIGEILEEEKWEVMTEFGKEGEGEGEFKFASDVACFSNGDIVVTDRGRDLISTFTSKGSYKSTGVHSETEDGQLKEPYRIAVTSDDLLLATDGHAVKVYDRELRYVRQFRPSHNEVEGQSGNLRGIAVDKKDRLAVVDWKRKIISLHNMDGSIISTIYYGDVSDICRLSVSSKERLIFRNFYKKKLVCLDFTGNEVFNISTIDGKPVKPLGVCCDDAGDIYASFIYVYDIHVEGTCEIHHYDASGEHIGCVARGLHNPLGMTFTPTGDLIVADHNSVKILRRV
ncbi:tripartite motif-containing protein 2-like [Asterias rubens]|uniref:tripartite motif-containing protein 2-like n=1 Tax=Asterias rubens TaxID=7604 RepID=UPI0014557FA8|nr:tripartite motif-containing protein 2-like [Asterias rubens]